MSRPTMNYGWLDEAVVLHEFGHAIGPAHEHQNPDKGIQWNEDAVIRDLSGPPPRDNTVSRSATTTAPAATTRSKCINNAMERRS